MELLSILMLTLLGLLQMNDTTEVAFVGDAMQHGPQLRAAAQSDGSYDYSDCFALIEDDIKAADYAVANLECPLGGAPYQGYPLFSAPDAYALQLQKSGFDLLLTANNHCMDAGRKGAERTVNALDEMGMGHIGTYLNADDRSKRLPYIVDVNGLKIAFLTYTYGTNGIPVKAPVVVDLIDENQIVADVKKAKDNGAEVVCVCVHWGNEYEMRPSKHQRKLAEVMKSAGVDLIIGSHPHVVQPMEVDFAVNSGRGVATVYSLGNFISNQNDVNSRGGAMAKVLMARYDDRPVLLGVKPSLFFCQKPIRGKDNYVVVPQELKDSVRADSKAVFQSFMRNAENLFEKYNINID